MITDVQYAAWLKDQAAIRCVLVEVDVGTTGGVVTRYLSNKAYVTASGDTPFNTAYIPRISTGVKFTRSLALDGTVSTSYGDLQLTNVDGSLDSWLTDYWSNRSIRIYIGDVQWARSDFRLGFSGITTGIDTAARSVVNIKISDKLQRLNTPASTVKLGGSSSLADTCIPVLFGECSNIAPLLIDHTINKYQVHNGPIEGIFEVRDNGIPVAYTQDAAHGTFTLTNAPYGTITCSAQGAKPAGVYTNTVAGIIQLMVTAYGLASQMFISSELNSTVFTAFNTANPQPVGVYLTNRENVLDICTQLAASVGARVVVDSTGLLSIVKLSLPQSTGGTAITSADMVDRSLEIAQLAPVVAAIKIGYCKNWTVQSTVAGGVDATAATLYGLEYLTVTRTDSAAAANYNLYTDPVEDDGLLLVGTDAIAEATRRLNMFSTQRKILKYSGFYHLINENLGAPQTITHSRFGLSGGVTGQILSIAVDFINPHVDIEVLV